MNTQTKTEQSMDGTVDAQASTEPAAAPAPAEETTAVAQGGDNAEAAPTADGDADKAEATETKDEGDKSFTKDEVNDIVVKRIDRVYKSLGFDDEDSLKDAIGKSQAYDVMKQRYDSMSQENADLKATVALMKNNISPSRYDDVRTYFKGKGVNIDDDSLKNETATHAEWLNQATAPAAKVIPLGSESKPPVEDDEEKAFAKMLGLKGFVD